VDLNLKGKFALVTGSSSGIGKAIAQSLKQEGCSVILNGRDHAKLEMTAKEIDTEYFFASDVSTEEGMDQLIKYLNDKNISLNTLVCNVGTGTSARPGEEKLEDWTKSLDMNLLSTALITNKLSNHLIQSKGSIVAVSSICGHAALGAPLTYSAAKSALNSYLQGLARVLGPKGVRVNAVSPGNVLFEGSVWDRKIKENKEAVDNMLKSEVSLQRLATPQEIANVVSFLSSEKASFITGQVIVADGGQLRN
jgi:3-oxoacyl-[acyl-carrier protein] reductase